ncbi:hypothetical protein CALVIDRAFT_567001 [Calocera viscosa TUFC12733]|uniref:Uncharacterized protein n=1 Tax=Calocera viscosa (strain TUFC12733) TaxID=1330018 RepID=A0A167IRZ5_CALVF|nr:hypothetical protein CALVIDRAFT_567001 [Calocera viscosa TUFC12733]
MSRHPPHKKRRVETSAKNVNWQAPFLWQQITAAQKAVGWSPTAIYRELCRVNPDVFEDRLRPSTIWRWINQPDGVGWTAAMLAASSHGHVPVYNKAGSHRVLAPFPDVVEAIKLQLMRLREVGLPVSAFTA